MKMMFTCSMLCGMLAGLAHGLDSEQAGKPGLLEQTTTQDTSQSGSGPAAPDDGEDEVARRRDVPSEILDHSEAGYVGWLLLDWAGGRQKLEELGLSIEVLETSDASVALQGGADSGDVLTRNLFELYFAYDMEPTLGIKGGTLSAGLQWISGVDASSRYGMAQAFSNIDSERRLQLSRLWYEQAFESSGTSLRFGKIDGNSQFAYVDVAGQFLHSSMGFSPTIFLMPTYPDAAYGATLVQEFGGGANVRGGVFDGALAEGVRTGERGPKTLFESPDGLFYIGEGGLDWSGKYPGRVAVGAWEHTSELARFDGGIEDGTSGSYALFEQRIWNQAVEGASKLDGFVQLGWADPDVSPFESHLGLGLALTNPFGRVGDHCGLGLTRAGMSSAPGSEYDESSETAIEMYYGFEPLPWLRLKPDLQYVVNPGGLSAQEDAWIFTLRATFAL